MKAWLPREQLLPEVLRPELDLAFGQRKPRAAPPRRPSGGNLGKGGEEGGVVMSFFGGFWDVLGENVKRGE